LASHSLRAAASAGTSARRPSTQGSTRTSAIPAASNAVILRCQTSSTATDVRMKWSRLLESVLVIQKDRVSDEAPATQKGLRFKKGAWGFSGF
jgi:hypothetical protein